MATEVGRWRVAEMEIGAMHVGGALGGGGDK